MVGYLHGKNLAKVWDAFIQMGQYEILARVLVMSFVFVLFFTILEIARVVGETKLFTVFFKNRDAQL